MQSHNVMLQIHGSSKQTDNMAPITLPLAIAQTIIWASIFYLFPAFLPTWEAQTEWSKTELTGAFTLALLATALASPLAGRVIDAGRDRALMVGGALLSVICLLALSQVNQLWQFYLVWLALGLCMAASLYEPCFANLIRHLSSDAKPVITRITLVAGLAGTVAFPTAHWLNQMMDWPQAVMCFAAGTGLITLPLTYAALTFLQLRYPKSKPVASVHSNHVPFTRAFWMLAIAFMIISLVHGMIVTHLLPLLAERSVASSFAILVASMIGPMQVLGRLFILTIQSRISNHGLVNLCFIVLVASIAILMFANDRSWMLVLFVFLFGAAYGMVSIARPVVARDLLGQQDFGAKSGVLSLLYLLGGASAPFFGSLLWQLGGYVLVLPLLIVIGIAGFCCYWIANRLSGSYRGA